MFEENIFKIIDDKIPIQLHVQDCPLRKQTAATT